MKLKLILFSILIIISCSCKNTEESTTEEDDISAFNDISDATSTPPETLNEPIKAENVVTFIEDGGVKKIPIWINGVGLEFIFDTGASKTLISLKEASYLVSKGEITINDIIDFQNYQTASGDIVEGMNINLRDVKIGNKIIYNVEATVVSNLNAPLLMGQSVLERFGSYTVDNNNRTITFND